MNGLPGYLDLNKAKTPQKFIYGIFWTLVSLQSCAYLRSVAFRCLCLCSLENQSQVPALFKSVTTRTL